MQIRTIALLLISLATTALAVAEPAAAAEPAPAQADDFPQRMRFLKRDSPLDKRYICHWNGATYNCQVPCSRGVNACNE